MGPEPPAYNGMGGAQGYRHVDNTTAVRAFACSMARALVLLLIFGCALAESLEYDVGDAVSVMVNKIGPYSNPTETYPYYSLPFCRPPDAELTTKKQDLGEVLSGDSMMSSLYKMRFMVPVNEGRICSVKLDGKQIKEFRDAILQEYYFEMLIGPCVSESGFGTTQCRRPTCLGIHRASCPYERPFHNPRLVTVFLATSS